MAAQRRPALTETVRKRPSLLGQEAEPAEPRPAETPAAETDAAPKRPPSRQGKRAVAFWLSPEAHKQLRHLSVQTDRSLQDLMEEAVDDLCAKHGLHRIAKD